MSDEKMIDPTTALTNEEKDILNKSLLKSSTVRSAYAEGFAAGIEAAAQEADRYEAGHKKIGATYEAETFATLAARIRNIKPEASDD